MIKQNIRTTQVAFKFELLADDNGTHINDSLVTVDFEPLLVANGLLNANDIVIIHVKARPIKNKDLWRYGLLHIDNEGNASYYLVDNYVSENVNSRGIKHNDVNAINPPNMCCLFEECTVNIDTLNDEQIAVITSI